MKYRNWIGILLVIFLFAISCEKDDLETGYDLLADPASANKFWVDLVAFNIDNNDSIRADENVLSEGVFGAYYEPIFGTTKADYVTQIRLSANNPTFSDSLKTADSATFYLALASSSLGDTISTHKYYLDENEDDNVDTFRLVTKYKLAKLYGNANAQMTMRVHTIGNYLYSTEFNYFSAFNQTSTNASAPIGTINEDVFLGSSTIKNEAVRTQYLNSNGTQVTSINDVEVKDIAPSIRVPLNYAFFQTNILDKQGSNDLSDDARFTRFIKGIKVSVAENDGFLLNFLPSETNLLLYYNFVKKKTTYTSGGVTKDTIYTGNTSFAFNLASSNNVRIGKYIHDRSGATYSQGVSSNMITGNSLLFLQGMGGPKIAIKFDSLQLKAVKDSVKYRNWSIIDAKLRFYEADIASNLTNPTKIHAYQYDAYKVPNNVISSSFDYDKIMGFSDHLKMVFSPGYSFNPTYDVDEDPKYYDIKVTNILKNIVEKDSINRPVIVEMGDFLYSNTNSYGISLPIIQPYFTKYLSQTPYNPYRMVFFGNTYADTTKKLRLEIIYNKN